jgi:hypothetical protein
MSEELTEQQREEMQSLLKSERRKATGQKILVGGGIIALIIFLLMRNRGGGGDRRPLLFKLRDTGLLIGTRPISVEDAISHVLKGGRRDALLQPSGSVPQGDVDFVIQQFHNAGIQLSIRQLTSSVYSRGLERYS